MPMKTVKVPKISCGHCVRAIQDEIGELDNVTKVSASTQDKMVTVEWNEPQTWANIKAALCEINYPPEE